MIHARELRIGNCIKDANGKIRFVTDRIISDIASAPERHGYEPLPLTAEWLEKFGFSNEGQNVFAKEHLKIGVDDNGGANWVFYFKQHLSLRSMSHVHQLQNLYFALTGEELTIKK